MSKHLIYGLCDPFTNELRYVGRSSSGLNRPREHLNPKRSGHLRDYCHNWIRSVEKKGSKPFIITIQTFENGSVLSEAEKYWIKFFRDAGCPLTNLTDGGEGLSGFRHSEETKRKMSLAAKGKKKSLQHRINIGKASCGKIPSEKTRKMLSEATKRQWKNLDVRKKMIEGMQRVDRSHASS